MRALSKHSRLPGRKREKCKNERRKAILQHTSQRLIALAGERAGPRDYKKCTGEGETRERERVAICWRTFYCLCWWFLSIALYISCAGRQSHTPLHTPKGGNPEQEEGKDVGGSSASCVPEYKRGFFASATTTHSSFIFSAVVLAAILIDPTLDLVFFLYSSSRARCPLSLYTHTMPARPLHDPI